MKWNSLCEISVNFIDLLKVHHRARKKANNLLIIFLLSLLLFRHLPTSSNYKICWCTFSLSVVTLNCAFITLFIWIYIYARCHFCMLAATIASAERKNTVRLSEWRMKASQKHIKRQRRLWWWRERWIKCEEWN